MKNAVIATIVVFGFATACAVRSERTVVEKPAPAPARATVVTTDPPPPPSSTTVVVPSR
jgi:hypothetical protein